jgi:hypothetical protein
MVLCSECPVESSSLPPLTSMVLVLPNVLVITNKLLAGAAATATGADGEPTAGTSSSGTSANGGYKLSPGAAAGIGVGAALLLVAIIGAIIFLFRRARKRKQGRHQSLAHSVPPTHHPSLAPTSPPPQFSPYAQPREVKTVYYDPPPMALGPQYGHQRVFPHELDSAAVTGSPQTSAYQAQSEGTAAERLPSPPSAGIIAPQPHAPPPTVRSSGFQYHKRSPGQISPPQGSQRSRGSNHDNSSYGFPSQEPSPNPDAEGFPFQQPLQQGGPGSPESQQRLFPRRTVGSPNLRGST